MTPKDLKRYAKYRRTKEYKSYHKEYMKNYRQEHKKQNIEQKFLEKLQQKGIIPNDLNITDL
jgi:hypothetical protein